MLGLIPIVRFLYFYFTSGGDGHLQSLVLGGVLLLMGFIAYLAGLVADLISFNRQLLEMTLGACSANGIESHKQEDDSRPG